MGSHTLQDGHIIKIIPIYLGFYLRKNPGQIFLQFFVFDFIFSLPIHYHLISNIAPGITKVNYLGFVGEGSFGDHDINCSRVFGHGRDHNK
jgi:hypothetical protein